MSILDGPTEPPKHMPAKLKVVLGYYALSLALDGYLLTLDSSATRTWIRIVIGVLVIAFLLRGSDSVRSIVRGFAALGVVFAVVVILQGVAIGMATTAGTFVMITGIVALCMSAFTFWALGQDDVQLWMATRTYGRVQ
jgi:hypothetical protein